MVFSKLSDLSNLQNVKQKLDNPELVAKLKEQADGDQVEKMIPVLKSLTSDTDSVSVSVPPVGNLTLRVVEREEKCIKYALENVPINANLWIQLLPIDANSCKMKVTIGADLNLIMRGMLGGKLEKGAEGIANMLSRMPYTEF
jgi:hypothetical protein